MSKHSDFSRTLQKCPAKKSPARVYAKLLTSIYIPGGNIKNLKIASWYIACGHTSIADISPVAHAQSNLIGENIQPK